MSATTRLGCAACALGAAALFATLGLTASGPVHAEDSGFWDTVRARAGVQAVPDAPSWFPRFGFERLAPRIRPVARPQPQVVQPEPASDAKLPDPSKRPNPLVTLLRDPTLRRGDIVMFPDGPRVFSGQPGAQHEFADFVKVAAAKDVPKSTRKALAALPAGENSAWSFNVGGAAGQVAQRGLDVEATAAIPGKKRSRR
jgi:hypothetical protein